MCLFGDCTGKRKIYSHRTWIKFCTMTHCHGNITSVANWNAHKSLWRMKEDTPGVTGAAATLVCLIRQWQYQVGHLKEQINVLFFFFFFCTEDMRTVVPSLVLLHVKQQVLVSQQNYRNMPVFTSTLKSFLFNKCCLNISVIKLNRFAFS